jgi:hypothetical protein
VNQVKSPNHWITLHLIGTKSNRDGIGARVTVSAGGRSRIGEIRSGSSYDSSSDTRPHFGLGSSDKIDFVDVRWPSGLTERFEGLKVDFIHDLKEGTGTANKPR